MSAVTAALLWAWAAWSVARRIAGEMAGLLAGLWVALPPVFLSFAQLSAHVQSTCVTLGLLTLAAGAALIDERAGKRERAIAWAVLGAAGGLGSWASPMMGMFLVAAGATIVVARPAVLRKPGPYVALGLFGLGSLPFWLWNLRHEWATFRHLASWGEPPRPLGSRGSTSWAGPSSRRSGAPSGMVTPSICRGRSRGWGRSSSRPRTRPPWPGGGWASGRADSRGDRGHGRSRSTWSCSPSG